MLPQLWLQIWFIFSDQYSSGAGSGLGLRGGGGGGGRGRHIPRNLDWSFLFYQTKVHIIFISDIQSCQCENVNKWTYTQVYYKEAVGAFVVFDVTRASTFEAVQKWKNDLDSKVSLPNGAPVPVVLLANKVFCAGLSTKSRSFFLTRDWLEWYNNFLNFSTLTLIPFKGLFTHAIFDVISGAISRTKRAFNPTLHEYFFHEASRGLERKFTYYFKTPFFPISANLVVFCRRVTRLQTRAG